MLLTIKDVKEARDLIIPELKKFSKKFPAVPLGYYLTYSKYSDEMFHMLVFPDAARKGRFLEEYKKINNKITNEIAWGFHAMEEGVTKLSGETIKNAPYQFLGGKMKRNTKTPAIIQ